VTPENGNTRCGGRTRKGKPCRAAATAGGLCFFHANLNKASELGRIGGRKKGHAAESIEPTPTVNNAIEVQALLAQLIDEVRAGKLAPRVATALAPFISLQLRAIQIADEHRVAELEKELAEVKETGGSDVRVLWIGIKKVDDKNKEQRDGEQYGSTDGSGPSKTLLAMP